MGVHLEGDNSEPIYMCKQSLCLFPFVPDRFADEAQFTIACNLNNSAIKMINLVPCSHTCMLACGNTHFSSLAAGSSRVQTGKKLRRQHTGSIRGIDPYIQQIHGSRTGETRVDFSRYGRHAPAAELHPDVPEYRTSCAHCTGIGARQGGVLVHHIPPLADGAEQTY